MNFFRSDFSQHNCFDILSCYCNASIFHSFSFLRSILILFLSILCWWSPDLFPCFGYYENAGINIHIKVFFWVYAIISLGEIPTSGLARSYFRCFIFWKLQTILQSELYHFTFLSISMGLDCSSLKSNDVESIFMGLFTMIHLQWSICQNNFLLGYFISYCFKSYL